MEFEGGGGYVKIAHLNLTVNDVGAAVKFLETYFSMKCGSRGNGFAVMYDDNGQFVLTFMRGKDVQYPKTFHIGFTQESREHVDQINQRLKNDDYKVSSPVDHHGYSFYVLASGGFTIEVYS
jgi:catechol-2,3-dioxygenase